MKIDNKIMRNALLLAGALVLLTGGAGEARADNEVQKLTASDAAAGDNFGQPVSVSGDTGVVGAPPDDYAAGDGAKRLACEIDDDCDDGDGCTVDTCNEPIPPGTCKNTYRRRPYGDIHPIPANPPAIHPCDAEDRARMGDCFTIMLDVACALTVMGDGFPYTRCPCADVHPCGGNGFITMLDVMSIFNAVSGSPQCPAPCP